MMRDGDPRWLRSCGAAAVVDVVDNGPQVNLVCEQFPRLFSLTGDPLAP